MNINTSHLHYPQQGSTAIFDPSTLRPRQHSRSESESDPVRPPRLHGSAARGDQMKQGQNVATPAEKRQWGPPPAPPTQSNKESSSFAPFKSLNGRVTPMEDLYQPSMSVRCDAEVANAMRPPSRAMSLYSNSVLYQPLTFTPQNPVWGNSMMFNNRQDVGSSGPNSSTLRGSPPNGPPAQRFTPPSDKSYHQEANQPNKKPNGTLTAPKVNGQKPSTPVQGQIKNMGFGPNGFGHPDMQNDPFEFHHLKSGDKHAMFPNGGPLNPVFVQSMAPFKASVRAGRDMVNVKIFERICIIHILLGLVLFSLGVARLVLLSVWGLGIELAYGVYVTFLGIIGIVGCRRRHYCSLVACCIMSALSCMLCIPPFVAGLMVTVPYNTTKFRKLSPDLFTSETEPYGVDILLSVMCFLELIVAIISSSLGCRAVGKFVERVKKIEQDCEHEKSSEEISNISSSIQKAALKMNH